MLAPVESMPSPLGRGDWPQSPAGGSGEPPLPEEAHSRFRTVWFPNSVWEPPLLSKLCFHPSAVPDTNHHTGSAEWFLHIARGPRNSANARAQRRNLRARDYFVCTSASAGWFRRYKALEDETLPAIPDRCWCIYADVATWIELPTANLCARFWAAQLSAGLWTSSSRPSPAIRWLTVPPRGSDSV